MMTCHEVESLPCLSPRFAQGSAASYRAERGPEGAPLYLAEVRTRVFARRNALMVARAGVAGEPTRRDPRWMRLRFSDPAAGWTEGGPRREEAKRQVDCRKPHGDESSGGD